MRGGRYGAADCYIVPGCGAGRWPGAAAVVAGEAGRGEAGPQHPGDDLVEFGRGRRDRGGLQGGERGGVRIVAGGGEPGRAGQVAGGQHQVAQHAVEDGGHVTAGRDVFAGVQPGEQYGGAAAGQLAAGVPGDDRSFGTGLGETCPLPVTSIAR